MVPFKKKSDSQHVCVYHNKYTLRDRHVTYCLNTFLSVSMNLFHWSIRYQIFFLNFRQTQNFTGYIPTRFQNCLLYAFVCNISKKKLSIDQYSLILICWNNVLEWISLYIENQTNLFLEALTFLLTAMLLGTVLNLSL